MDKSSLKTYCIVYLDAETDLLKQEQVYHIRPELAVEKFFHNWSEAINEAYGEMCESYAGDESFITEQFIQHLENEGFVWSVVEVASSLRDSELKSKAIAQISEYENTLKQLVKYNSDKQVFCDEHNMDLDKLMYRKLELQASSLLNNFNLNNK